MITDIQKSCKHEWLSLMQPKGVSCCKKCDIHSDWWELYQQGVIDTNAEWLARIDEKIKEAKKDYKRDRKEVPKEWVTGFGQYFTGYIESLEKLKSEASS